VAYKICNVVAEIHHSRRLKTTTRLFPPCTAASKSFALKETGLPNAGSAVALCTGLGRVTKALVRTISTQSPSIGVQF
jgi:hypothetical protein